MTDTSDPDDQDHSDARQGHDSPDTGSTEGPDETRLRAFGAAVRRRRSDLGLSQEKLAERAGVHRTYVGGVERGERNISLVNILNLADALDLTAPELMERYEAELRVIEEFGDS